MKTVYFNYTFVDQISEYNADYFCDKKVTNEKLIDFYDIKLLINRINSIEGKLKDFYRYYKNLGWNFTCNAQIMCTMSENNPIEDSSILSFIRFSIINKGVTFFREIPIRKNINHDLESIKYIFDQEVYQDLTIINDYDIPSFISLSPSSSAYLIHEVFGHTFEKDSPLLANNILKKYKVGDRMLEENISVYDDPNFSDEVLRFSIYDDEGKKYQKKYVIKNGRLDGLITNKRIGLFAKKANYRMTNLILEAKQKTAILPEEYVHLDYTYQGHIDLRTGEFYLWSSKATLYKQQKPIGRIYNVCLKGNISDLFNHIKVIDCINEYSVGTCIKLQQKLIVGMSSPTLFIDKKLNISV